MKVKMQEEIIDEGVYHLRHGSKQVYEFGGLAGTGKSYTLNKIIEKSGIDRSRIAPMAYIGQAAIVMRSKGFWNAKSIHSTLYEPVLDLETDYTNNLVINGYYNVPDMCIYFRPKDLSDIDYLVIDEGYTVPLSMRYDIEKTGKKIIVAGDPNQLPPVADKPAFLVDPNIKCLTEIMRQDKYSSILYIADMLRRGISISCGLYGNVLVIEEKDLTDEMLVNSWITICGKNKTKEELNARIRRALGYHGTLPSMGEKVICRKNNWLLDVEGITLANGLIGTVVNQPSPLDFDGKTFKIDFKPDMFNCYFQGLYCDYKYFIAEPAMKNELKKSKYSVGEKFDWAYAITTHLAQGAQYPSGIYIEEYLNSDINSKINYVGSTRFEKFLIYVLPNRRIFY
jgi:exodeoxyribonuclease-5